MDKVIQTRRWLERLARMGYGTRGAVYLIVGLFALSAALFNNWKIVGSKGAIHFVQGLSLGAILLVALIVGLIGYSVWRFLQSVLDADRQGRELTGLAIRGGLLISALIHISLALYAASLLFNAVGGGGDSREFTQWLMSSAPGQWALIAVGVGIIIGGAAQCYKGASKRFMKYLDFGQAGPRWAVVTCVVGLIGRGLVFATTGVTFIVAVARQESEDAAGLGATLQTLREQAFGRWLLGLAALGLLAFAAYCFIEARYRRIPTDQVDLPT